MFEEIGKFSKLPVLAFNDLAADLWRLVEFSELEALSLFGIRLYNLGPFADPATLQTLVCSKTQIYANAYSGSYMASIRENVVGANVSPLQRVGCIERGWWV